MDFLFGTSAEDDAYRGYISGLQATWNAELVRGGDFDDLGSDARWALGRPTEDDLFARAVAGEDPAVLQAEYDAMEEEGELPEESIPGLVNIFGGEELEELPEEDDLSGFVDFPRERTGDENGFCWLAIFPRRFHASFQELHKPAMTVDEIVVLLGTSNLSDEEFATGQDILEVLLLEQSSSVHFTQSIHSTQAHTSQFDLARSQFMSPMNTQVLESYSLGRMQNAKAEIDRICPWGLKPELRGVANRLGIPYSVMSGESHTHPIHAALRRRQLYKILPSYIKTDTTVMWMTGGNFSMLEEGVDGVRLDLVNPLLEPKDIGRYPVESIPSGVFDVGQITTPTVLMHDAGHFLTPAVVAHIFASNPDLRFMILTHVFPLAALVSDISPEPKVYSYKVENGRLYYVPEGDYGGMYEQPFDASLLLARTITETGSHMALNCGIVDSTLNSHVQVITRYQLPGAHAMTIPVEDYMPMPVVFRAQPSSCMVPVRAYKMLYSYGKVLQKASEKDMWAKIRQMADSVLDNMALKDVQLLVAVVMEVLEKGEVPALPSKHYNTLWGKMKYNTVGRMVKWKRKHFDVFYYERFMDLASEPCPLRLLPLLDVRVAARPGEGFGLEWTVPPEWRACWLKRFGDWCKTAWTRMLSHQEIDDWQVVSMDDTGRVYMPGDHLIPSLNRFWIGSRGAAGVREEQVEDFWRVVGREERLPPEISGRRRAQMERIAEEEAEAEAEVLRRAPGRGLVNLFPFDDELFRDDPLETYPRWCEAHPEATVADHAEWLRHVEMGQYGVNWRNPQARDQLIFARKLAEQADPKVRETPAHWHNPFRRIMAEAPFERFMASAESLVRPKDDETSLSSDSASDFGSIRSITQPTTGQTTPAMRSELHIEEYDVVTSEGVRARDLEVQVDFSVDSQDISQQPDEEAVSLVSTVGTEREAMAPSLDAEWAKMMSSQLRVPFKNPRGLRGEALWDNLFPKTCGKRYSKTPFTNIISFPDIPYDRNDCLLDVFSELTGERKTVLLLAATRVWPKDEEKRNDDGLYNDVSGYSTRVLEVLALHYHLNIHIAAPPKIWGSGQRRCFGVKEGPAITVSYKPGHWYLDASRNRKHMLIKKPKEYITLPHVAKELVKTIEALPTINFKPWIPEFRRAEAYTRALYDGTTGLIGQNPANKAMLKAMEDVLAGAAAEDRPRWLAVIEGDPGCRKSSALQKVLRQRRFHTGDSFQVILPTTILRQDWADKLGMAERHKATGKGTPSYYCLTFEKAIVEGNSGYVIVMDEDKLPLGYQAMKALIHPRACYFIRLGDRFQTQWHEPNEDCVLNSSEMPLEGELYSRYSDRYLVGTWRFGPGIANLFRMPTFSRSRGGIFFSRVGVSTIEDLSRFYPGEDPEQLRRRLQEMIVVSPADQDVRTADVLNDNENMTYTSSQGRTAPLVVVYVTETAVRVADVRAIYTAMTRSSEDIIVCQLYSRHNDNLARVLMKPILRELEYYASCTPPYTRARIVPEHTVDVRFEQGGMMGSKVVLAGPPDKVVNRAFVEGFCGAPNSTMPADMLNGGEFIDPDLKFGGYKMLRDDEPAYEDKRDFLVHATRMQEIDARNPDAPVMVQYRSRAPRTHLPSIPETVVIESEIGRVKERYGRELKWKGIYSEQFPDEYILREDAGSITKQRGKKMGVPFGQMSAILSKLPSMDDPRLYKPMHLSTAQRQRNSDSSSFHAGRAQRIAFATELANERLYNQESNEYGPALWASFKQSMGFVDPVGWDEEHYQQCIARFEERRAERSEAMKRGSANRSDPLFTTMLLGKSQIKTKREIPDKAKPLQTILVHADEYLFEFGPLGIYLLDKLLERKPGHIYWHARESLQGMEDWFKEYWPNQRGGFESDMTGFDSAQDHNALHEEVCLMQWFNVPQGKIDRYVRHKISTPVGHHIMAILRNSGEIFTWLFNTIHTQSRRHLKCVIPAGTPQAYSGDDEALPKQFPEREGWRAMSTLSTLVEKEEVVDSLHFCGYIVGSFGVIKDPVILYRKLAIAKEIGKLKDVWAGYFLDWCTIYLKGDELVDILDGDELEYAQVLNDVIFRIRKWSDHSLRWQKSQFEQIKANRGLEAVSSSALRFAEEVLPTLPTPDESIIDNWVSPITGSFFSGISGFEE